MPPKTILRLSVQSLCHVEKWTIETLELHALYTVIDFKPGDSRLTAVDDDDGPFQVCEPFAWATSILWERPLRPLAHGLNHSVTVTSLSYSISCRVSHCNG